MRGGMRATWLVALSLALGLIAGLVAQAWAQYPPVAGSLVLGAGNATPGVGEDVTITASVLDQSGQPAAGAECTFSIAEQPGDDASVETGPFTTDADGNVSTTLNAGRTAGTIVVEANCGELSAQVTLSAECPPQRGAGEDPFRNATVFAEDIGIAASSIIGIGQQTCPGATGGEEPAAPPASLPETGSGSASGGTAWAFWALIAAGAIVGLAGLGIAWGRMKA